MDPQTTPNSFDLTIKTLKNKSFTVSVAKSSTISQLKSAIEESQGIPIDKQRLILRDPQVKSDLTLDNDAKTMSQLGINGQSSIILCMK